MSAEACAKKIIDRLADARRAPSINDNLLPLDDDASTTTLSIEGCLRMTCSRLADGNIKVAYRVKNGEVWFIDHTVITMRDIVADEINSDPGCCNLSIGSKVCQLDVPIETACVFLDEFLEWAVSTAD